MKKNIIMASLALPLLAGCSAPRKVIDTSKLYVGTYTQIEKDSGVFLDTYLCISFVDASSYEKQHEPDLQINLNSGGLMKLSEDTPSKQVRYYDVAEGFSSARPSFSSLSDYLLAGGLVEVFECASKYDSSIKDPAVSAKTYFTTPGYAYSLSTFSVAGEELSYNKTPIWTWKN